ncbi:MAG: c-type cytochrome [Acidobacteriota bacterium]|nr:c-type cytochrome [Blastocatellia bacterium]MDW8411255.1 c-type cytochrome [Acidobacteriota bacterium]
MIARNTAFFIAGFTIGLVISFFIANAQYQKAKSAQQSIPPGSAEEKLERPEKSKAGQLVALGATEDSDRAKTLANSNPKPMEQVYKNIQVLKGVPAGQLRLIMTSFTEALGVHCVYCHVSVDEPHLDDKPEKAKARQMIQMVQEINKKYPTQGLVTCFTCHRGSIRPAY